MGVNLGTPTIAIIIIAIITVIIIVIIIVVIMMMVTREKKIENPRTNRFLVEFKSTNCRLESPTLIICIIIILFTIFVIIALIIGEANLDSIIIIIVATKAEK